MPTPDIEQILLQRVKDIRTQVENGGMSANALMSAKTDLDKWIRDIDSIKDKLSDIDGANKLILDTRIKLNEELKKELALHTDNDNLLRTILQSELGIEQRENQIEKKRRENFNRYIKGVDTISNSIKQIGVGINSLIAPWAKIDQAAANYAKSIGASVQGMKYMRDATLRNVTQNRIGINLGYSADELIKIQEGYLKSVGRNILVSNQGQENLAAMSRVMGENQATEMAMRLENFGVSISEAGKISARMFNDASKAGLSMEKYSKNFTQNLAIAQNFTFRNGLRGLESMAKKATEMRIDMQQISNFAEKVSTIEGSMDVASKLQVLGGSFSALADPLGMLNEGLNDMEGLNDRFISMIKGMGSVVNGEVQVSSYNKRRIKAAAEAMGMNYTQVMEQVNNSTRREEIERQIRMAGNPNIDENLAELIKNAGVIENGKAGVRNSNGDFVELKDVTVKMANDLIAQTRSEADNIVDIATNLRGIKDIMEGFSKQKDSVQARMFGWLGEGVKGLVAALGTLNGLLGAMVLGKTLWGAFRGGMGMWDNISSIFGKGGGVGIGGGISGGSGGGGGAGGHAPRGGGLFGGWFNTGVSKGAQKAMSGGIMGRLRYINKGAKLSTKLRHAGELVKGGGGRILAPLASVAAGAGRYLSDMDDERMSTQKKTGRVAGASIGAGAGAVLGTMLGGPLGGIVGGYLGEVMGTWVGGGFANQKRRNRVFDELRGGLSGSDKKAFEEMTGDYSVKTMRAIREGLATGTLSDKVVRKLKRRGDYALLEQIEGVEKSKKREDTNKDLAKKPKHYDKAVFYISNGVFAGNLNPDTVLSSMPLARTGNPRVYPAMNKSVGFNRAETPLRDKISIDISGTLTLRDMNGNKFDINDIGNKLLNSSDFVKRIASAVDRAFNVSDNGTYNRNDISGRYTKKTYNA